MANQQDINYHSLIYHIIVWLDIFLQNTTIHTQCVVYRLHFPPSLEFIRSRNALDRKTANWHDWSYQSLIAEAFCRRSALKRLE